MATAVDESSLSSDSDSDCDSDCDSEEASSRISVAVLARTVPRAAAAANAFEVVSASWATASDTLRPSFRKSRGGKRVDPFPYLNAAC